MPGSSKKIKAEVRRMNEFWDNFEQIHFSYRAIESGFTGVCMDQQYQLAAAEYLIVLEALAQNVAKKEDIDVIEKDSSVAAVYVEAAITEDCAKHAPELLTKKDWEELFSEELKIEVMDSQEMVGTGLQVELTQDNKTPDLIEEHQNDINAEGVTKPHDAEAPKAPDIAVKIRREVEATAADKHQEKDYSCRYEATVTPVSPPCSYQSTQGETTKLESAHMDSKEEINKLKQSAVKDHELHYIAQDDRESSSIMGEGAGVHSPSSIEFYDTWEKLVNNIIPSKGFDKLKIRLTEKYVHNEKSFVSSEQGLRLPCNDDPAAEASVGDKYVYSKSARASQFIHGNDKLAQYNAWGAKHPTQQESDMFDLEQQFGDLQQAGDFAKLKATGTVYLKKRSGNIVLIVKSKFTKKGDGASENAQSENIVLEQDIELLPGADLSVGTNYLVKGEGEGDPVRSPKTLPTVGSTPVFRGQLDNVKKRCGTLLTLGELGIECIVRNNTDGSYGQAMEGLHSCREKRKDKLPHEARQMAGVQHQFGVALTYHSRHDMPAKYFDKSVKTLNSVPGKLKVDTFSTRVGEIDGLEKLVPNFRERIQDTVTREEEPDGLMLIEYANYISRYKADTYMQSQGFNANGFMYYKNVSRRALGSSVAVHMPSSNKFCEIYDPGIEEQMPKFIAAVGRKPREGIGERAVVHTPSSIKFYKVYGPGKENEAIELITRYGIVKQDVGYIKLLEQPIYVVRSSKDAGPVVRDGWLKKSVEDLILSIKQDVGGIKLLEHSIYIIQSKVKN